MRILFGAFALLLTAQVSAPQAWADSWAMPERRIILSANKQYRLTVVPRAISSQLNFFEDKVKGRQPAGQAAGKPATANAILERRSGNGWATLWAAPLVNEVSPVDSIVSNDGKTVVTFDNWHSMGYGDDVVVIYGADGTKLHQFKLIEIMPEPFASSASRTVSSIHWRGQPTFAQDGSIMIPLRIRRSGENAFVEDPYEVVAMIDPRSGAISPKDRGRWDQAQILARETKAEQERMEAEQKRFFVEPLVAPTSDKEPDWHAYLNEAFFRLDPDWCGGMSVTKVLRDPKAENYAASVQWLDDALNDRDDYREGAITIGSPDADNLVREIERIAPSLKSHGLANFTIYISARPVFENRLKRALSGTGAKLVLLDPNVPIPQRPNRFDGSCDPMAEIETAAEALADEVEQDR